MCEQLQTAAIVNNRAADSVAILKQISCVPYRDLRKSAAITQL
jgi:hypothetical protein